ncbi:toxin-activating lysine-acyltransferase [Halotia branconii]|uniref:RTX toxin-activating lysine-acyltransferase n=1 Tax=Halotia branconii CENA392 TaxID=1539056 RepID=A0AAJ6P838_9CYAN|nr:toxin-activating lysine-acyltransferase [Halotia branconii]WGV24211.1 toxin-activating lysine-acyltransferase [Halotia branconii CENA392]
MQLLSVSENKNLETTTLERKEANIAPSFSAQQRLQMIGSITHLMMSSQLHQKYKIVDIVERFVPALIHNQFRYYEINGNPIGFVNWAWLSDEVEQKFITGKYVLHLDEWLGGNNLWFPEFVAPFGHARLIVKDLRTNILPKGTPAKSFKIRPDGSLRSVSHWTV